MFIEVASHSVLLRVPGVRRHFFEHQWCLHALTEVSSMSYYFPLHRLSSIYTDHRGFRRLKCTIYTHLQCRRNIQIHIFIDWWGIQLLIVGLLWTWRHIYANNMDAFIQALGSLNICCCTSVAKSPSSWEKAMLRWHLSSTMVERWTDGRDLAITQEKLS